MTLGAGPASRPLPPMGRGGPAAHQLILTSLARGAVCRHQGRSGEGSTLSLPPGVGGLGPMCRESSREEGSAACGGGGRCRSTLGRPTAWFRNVAVGTRARCARPSPHPLSVDSCSSFETQLQRPLSPGQACLHPSRGTLLSALASSPLPPTVGPALGDL
ncbi:hypothetical protein HJG60_011768 [Phyllostomus discolor]|uniref:Uncharacterized protein n=1 Tax=Phyllostomus discolor TaxID=89673 RepID=A0A833ZKN1_9CHIR|nr:hypothetical protein HJG60_011768 [Phyllostomus discolor]